jgi:hypothetical protein
MQLSQRCWNHEAREAACRCPGCGRSYCRECVSEHEGRLMCASCLSAIAASRKQEAGVFRNLAPPAMIAAAILLAWLIYWAAGASLIGIIHRLQNTAVAPAVLPAVFLGDGKTRTGGKTASATNAWTTVFHA